MAWMGNVKQGLKDMVMERERCTTCGNDKHAGASDCWYCDRQKQEQERR